MALACGGAEAPALSAGACAAGAAGALADADLSTLRDAALSLAESRDTLAGAFLASPMETPSMYP